LLLLEKGESRLVSRGAEGFAMTVSGWLGDPTWGSCPAKVVAKVMSDKGALGDGDVVKIYENGDIHLESGSN
jgi:hypothetical protein